LVTLLLRLRRAISQSILRECKPYADRKLMTTMDKKGVAVSLIPQVTQIPQITQIAQGGKLSWSILAEFELLLVDFQGFDPGRKGRLWNSKLSRCSGRSGNSASSLSERRLDNFPLASRLTAQGRRRLTPRCLRRSPFGKPRFVD
jgi:hypothetical protein